MLRSRKTETGAGTLQGGVVSGGDEALGTGVAPATSYGWQKQYPVSNDPATGVPFTPADAAAADLKIVRDA
jgi:hypothetical protein